MVVLRATQLAPISHQRSIHCLRTKYGFPCVRTKEHLLGVRTKKSCGSLHTTSGTCCSSSVGKLAPSFACNTTAACCAACLLPFEHLVARQHELRTFPQLVQKAQRGTLTCQKLNPWRRSRQQSRWPVARGHSASAANSSVPGPVPRSRMVRGPCAPKA